jgi:hypothetical protein
MSIRRAGPATVLAALASLMLLAACGATSSHPHTASSASPRDRLSVKSSLASHSTLPHRIPWTATPSVPPAQVSEVDFLIDGRLLWVEHNAPYDYGSEGNFLVTSFLSAGRHTFTVRVATLGGKTASATATARVPPAPAPPSGLGGTWRRFVKQPDVSAPPSGYWHLAINRVGWKIYDTSGGGNVLDVAYLKPGLLEVRTGMATGHDEVAGAASDEDLSGFCNNEPGVPVRYRWSVRGSKLQFRYVSGQACPGFTQFLSDAPMTRSPGASTTKPSR